jgi:hypothetical protein
MMAKKDQLDTTEKDKQWKKESNTHSQQRSFHYLRHVAAVVAVVQPKQMAITQPQYSRKRFAMVRP